MLTMQMSNVKDSLYRIVIEFSAVQQVHGVNLCYFYYYYCAN